MPLFEPGQVPVMITTAEFADVLGDNYSAKRALRLAKTMGICTKIGGRWQVMSADLCTHLPDAWDRLTHISPQKNNARAL